MENNVDAVLQGLNGEQLAAVKNTEGPVLIVAGAGSGKTRVLTSRIAYILSQGCDASRILALTFTKKAASEMKERIALMVGEKRARRLCMGTFHSVFIRFLRDYADSIGYPSSFTIYDTGDSTSAIKACIKELQLDDKVYKPKDVLARISMAKNNLVTADVYRNSPNIVQSDTHSRRPRLCDIYSLYVQKCRLSGVMDFDDILLNMNILLRDNPTAREEIAARFSYLLVDEYQDTNFAQYLILKKLAAAHRNLCVVGDDSQSIYAFRGAKIENILNFKKDYPDSKTFRLERNYRSTKTIVDAANSLIAHNQGRIPKTCFSEGADGEKIRLISAYTEKEEAMLIVSSILDKMRTCKAQYQDCAILYRTNSQSRALEEQLRGKNIPYIIFSGNSFFDRAEVKDMMAYFKLAVNPQDDESFKRVVNKPARGIGGTSMDALEAAARAHQTSLFKAAFIDDLETYGLKAAAVQKIRDFCRKVNEWASKVSVTDAHELALLISDRSELYRFYKEDTSIEGMSRTANVDELLNSVSQFVEERQDDYLSEMEADDVDATVTVDQLPLVTLDAFLENVSLLSNVDVEDGEDGNNKVALMTVHSAKGLEFPYVFVAGMEENLFPPGGMMASPNDIEEERRLFYVAITRAEKTVELSFAETRFRNGKHESNSPSRFIREIDPRYIANPLSDVHAGDDDDDDRPLRFGSFGSRGSSAPQRSGSYGQSDRSGGVSPRYGSSGSRYGASGTVRYEKRQPQGASVPRGGVVSKPAAPSTTQYQGKASVLNRPLPPKIPDSEFVPVPMSSIKAGQRVEHNRFGLGLVKDITGQFPELKATIEFDAFGTKQILLKYAKLRFPK